MLDTEFWKHYFQTYDVLNSAIPYRELLNDLVEQLDINKGEKIFDAGSGTGNLSLKIKEENAKAIALDYSEEGVKIHKEKDSTAEIRLGDITKKLPYPDKCFDKIVSNNVIYTINVKERKKVFDEFFRVLKPGGKIVVADIKRGFKPKVIFFDHIKKSFKKNGFSMTFIDAMKYASTVIKMFYYNSLIKKEHKEGSYSFLDNGEHERLLKNSGFEVRNGTKMVYSGQSYLDIGYKNF